MDFLPFSKLTQQSISPRVRNVLESAYQLSWRELESGLKRTLDEFEKELFRRAEKAPTNDQQNRFFEALKAVRKSNSMILIAMRDDFQRGMLTLLQPQRSANGEVKANQATLALVDNTTLELELAISELAAKAEIKSSQLLGNTAIRFAVITGGAPVHIDDVPVGPHRVLAALSRGLSALEVSTPIKVDLLRTFDKLVLARMPEILEAINKQFADQRVFANLNLGLGRKPETKTAEKSPETTEAKEQKEHKEAAETVEEKPSQFSPTNASPDKSSHPAPSEPLFSKPTSESSPTVEAQPPPRPRPVLRDVSKNPFLQSQETTAPKPAFDFGLTANQDATNLAANRESVENFAQNDPFGLSGLGSGFSASDDFEKRFDSISATPHRQSGPQSHSTPQHSPQSHLPRSHSPQPASSERIASAPPVRSSSADSDSEGVDLEMFATLRELLSGKRAGSSQGEAATINQGPQATIEDVQSVLTVLQSQASSPVMVGGKWKSRRIIDIKQDMLSQLRQMHGGQTPQIEPETSDTVDLVGMLFDHVLADSKPSSTTHSLLTKLQVPVLKVAIKDKSFFSRRNHPARQLLNTIAENGMFWSDGDEVDDALVERMQMVVDRITSEYDNDIGVFETMLGDLGRHVSTLQKKAEVSEKRHVEAAKGRERMELARKNATQSIDGFVKGRLLPPLVVHLLEGAWADVLALTQLRQDVDSPVYHERLEVAEQLAGCFDLDNPVSKDEFNELRPVLEEGMSLVGFHGPEIERTLSAISELVVEGDALVPALQPAEEREVTELVKNKARIGQEQDGPKTPELAAAHEKQSILAHLRKEEKIQLTPKEQQTFDRLKQMPFGTWFEFVLNQQGDVARRKLSWFSPVTGRCLFVNSRGVKVAEKSLEELSRDLVRGNAKLWEPQTESVIDRAWRSIKNKLKSWTQGDMSLNEVMAAES